MGCSSENVEVEVGRKTDEERPKKWSIASTLWQPLLHSGSQQGRKQARPRRRREQDFVDYISQVKLEFKGSWHKLARDSEWWLAETFAKN